MTPSTISSSSPKIQELFQKALHVRNYAYAPYSQCKVGAAIKISSGQIFTGCNVENASYGATLCAERSAIVKAISDTGKIQITEIMVITDATPPWPPCGICRQMISEFISDPNQRVPVYTANIQGDLITLNWNEVYPQGFTPDYLPNSP